MDELRDIGFGMDFRELKKLTDQVLEPLDHHLLNEIPPFDHINPTAENLARYIFEGLHDAVKPARLLSVEVSESDDFSARYSPE